MSINQFSSPNTTKATTLWWTQHAGPSRVPLIPNNPFFNLINNNNDDDEVENIKLPLYEDEAATTTTPEGGEEAVEEEEKEPLFEKSLTPSDVGKLNRLVIPKQYAEKYFPLGGGGDSVESKGLLLSLEDESGICWRFRYCYWNSSQSYVLTKGWSRYVKDKRLDAGDVVLFQRHRFQPNRLFIGWKRSHFNGGSTVPAHVGKVDINGNKNNGNDNVQLGWTTGFYSAHRSYPISHRHFPYLHAGGGSQQDQKQRTPMRNTSNSRVLRLFGVNMECQSGKNDSETLSSYNMSSTPTTTTLNMLPRF